VCGGVGKIRVVRLCPTAIFVLYRCWRRRLRSY